MNKAAVRWLVAAAVLVIAGLAIFAAVMAINDFSFERIGTVKYETNEYKINEDFSEIYIDTDTADVTFCFSDGEECRVVCYERENVRHLVEVAEGALNINISDTRKWYEFIEIMNFKTSSVTVYLPKDNYNSLCIRESTGNVDIPADIRFESIDIKVDTGDVKCYASASGLLKISGDTGDIGIENASVGEMELDLSTGEIIVTDVSCEGRIEMSVSTGNACLTRVTCDSFTTDGNTGDVNMESVVAVGKIEIARSTGDVKFDGCDAGEMYVETSTGDVKGTLISPKKFFAQSDTGNVDIPTFNDSANGKCEITSSTGNIVIKIIED